MAFAKNGNGKPADGSGTGSSGGEARPGVPSNRASPISSAALRPPAWWTPTTCRSSSRSGCWTKRPPSPAAASGRETGGILIGRLHHDAALPEIFAEVSAQIPAEHTLGTVARLTFTAETWSAASAAIRLRNQGEVYLGYWHSHPVREWCRAKECTLEKQKTCRLAKDFFSAKTTWP